MVLRGDDGEEERRGRSRAPSGHEGGRKSRHAPRGGRTDDDEE